MAPSSKSERGAASGGKRGSAELGRGARREHVVRQLERIKVSGSSHWRGKGRMCLGVVAGKVPTGWRGRRRGRASVELMPL